MRQRLRLLVLLFGAASAALAQGPQNYIVTLADAATASAAQYQNDDRVSEALSTNYLDRGVVAAVQALERRGGFRSYRLFSRAIRGFAAALTPAQVAQLRQEPAIATIEADAPARIVAQTLPWGIDRTEADLSSTQAGNGSGTVTGVHAYVIDTGVQADHPDLNVVEHVNFANGPNEDCNGHGTHVAGTLGAKDDSEFVVGMAPGVPLHGVRVLSCAGFGLTSWIVSGVDWVTANAIKPAVANMSIGSTLPIGALNQAVRNSAASGIFYAVAAGNEGVNACISSPAGAALDLGFPNGVAGVAATDIAEQEASFSNFGPCVDIWAPGVGIPSTYPTSTTATLSGTSMASPHVAGAAALFLSRFPNSPMWFVEAALENLAAVPGTTSKDGSTIRRLKVDGF